MRHQIPRSFEHTTDPVRDGAANVRRCVLRADRI
jgi:hypothetical protein